MLLIRIKPVLKYITEAHLEKRSHGKPVNQSCSGEAKHQEATPSVKTMKSSTDKECLC